MQSPYTPSPADALIVAQSSVATALTAIVLFRPIRPWVSSLLFLMAVWLVVLLPVEPEFLRSLGATLQPEHVHRVLHLAAGLATIALVFTGRPFLIALAIAGQIGLHRVIGYITDSDQELAALHLAWFGLLLGAHLRKTARLPEAKPLKVRSNEFADHDVFLFVLATILAALVSTFVLKRSCDSADEWAYTYQAAVFWRGKAYGVPSPCSTALQNFWVFSQLGRQFSQYTPGWPLVLTPFFGLHAVWLAAPCSLGLLVVGVARVARRGAAELCVASFVPSTSMIESAGMSAGLVTMFGSTMLINGASRFPHVFVAATFAWSIEAACAVACDELERDAQWRWGIVLGLATSFMICSRPADGATLGIGVFAYFVYALVRGRIPWRAFAGTSLAFSLVAGVTLVILRLQLGRWFTTGYSLTNAYYPWAKFTYSVPPPNTLKWSIPLATGSYCWWPCSPALGLAGVMLLRGRARGIGVMFVLGIVPLLVYYSLVELGRGWDFGYGPRYQMGAVVPMAVGTGVVLAPLWHAARVRVASFSAFQLGGPAALALAAIVVGVVRIAPLVYPTNYDDVRLRNVVYEAVKKEGIHDAVVTVAHGSTISDPLDVTQNLPLDLYPDQDVIYASERTPELNQCLREHFPNRKFYRAVGRPEISLLPE